MLCSDPAISYLKDFGYSVLRLPRRDFAPLQMLATGHKGLDPMGALGTVMTGGGALPALKIDEAAANVSGQRTSELSIGVGLSILGSILGAMGGGKIGLEAAYKGARKVTFEFNDVLRDSLEIAVLDKYLGRSDVDPASVHMGTLLESDNIYIVTATLKSRKFTIDAKADRNASAGLDLPALQKLVGAKVKIALAAGSANALVYESIEPLVFGFQAVRLYFDDGHYSAFEPLSPGDTAARDIRLSKRPQGVTLYETRGAFVGVA